MENNDVKYGKSLSGRKCLGPCYKMGTYYIHPITLEKIMNPYINTCPTYRWWDVERKKYLSYDRCNFDKNNNDQYDSSYILSPNLYFDEKIFLNIYYKIHSFNSGVEWLKNNLSKYYTSLRILECLFIAYGNSSSILTDDFIEYYVDFIKMHNMKYIYKKLKSYILIENNNISFTNFSVSNTKLHKEYRTEIINFIINNLVNHNNVYTVIRAYIKANNKKWNEIEKHNTNIIDNFIDYCINNIKKI